MHSILSKLSVVSITLTVSLKGEFMKKELFICIFVIALVIIGDVITQNHTKQCVEQLNQVLSNMKNKIIVSEKSEEQQEELKTKSKEIRELWNNMQETLSFYIEHDELEKVETQLALLIGEMETELYDDAVPEIEKCEFILEHIADKTSLTIKNIF